MAIGRGRTQVICQLRQKNCISGSVDEHILAVVGIPVVRRFFVTLGSSALATFIIDSKITDWIMPVKILSY